MFKFIDVWFFDLSGCAIKIMIQPQTQAYGSSAVFSIIPLRYYSLSFPQ